MRTHQQIVYPPLLLLRDVASLFHLTPPNDPNPTSPVSAIEGDTSTLHNEGDFLVSLRPFLILGRITGLLPLKGLFFSWSTTEDESSSVKFCWKGTVFMGIPVLMFLLTNVLFSWVGLFRIFAGHGGGNASKLALAAKQPVFYSIATFVYAFFLLRSRRLASLFQKWRQVTSQVNFKQKDRTLSRHVKISVSLLLTLGLVQNLFSILDNFPLASRGQEAPNSNYSPLEYYYRKSHPFWATLIPHNIPLTLAILVGNTLAAFAWNYADIFILLSSRALYYKFKLLLIQTEQQLQLNSPCRSILPPPTALFHKVDNTLDQSQVRVNWSEVRRDHLTLCKLLEEFQAFLSPLIFASYSVNIFFICLELHQGLTPQDDRSPFDSAFSAVSFACLVTRVLGVSLTGAKVNEYVHLILIPIQRCSSEDYCIELERLERMLACGPIGLGGLGCFVITRAFLLVVLSVIFTVEIVLLQASATPTAATHT